MHASHTMVTEVHRMTPNMSQSRERRHARTARLRYSSVGEKWNKSQRFRPGPKPSRAREVGRHNGSVVLDRSKASPLVADTSRG
jgi:hypothetical protein